MDDPEQNIKSSLNEKSIVNIKQYILRATESFTDLRLRSAHCEAIAMYSNLITC